SSASMKASGSGRTPENFSMAASTSRVAASPSGSSPAGSAFALCLRFAARKVGEQLEQHVRRRAKRDTIEQYVAQAAAADRKISRGAERRYHGIDERGMIGREHAEGVAPAIVDARPRRVELNVPGFLLRTRLVQPGARQENRLRRILA